MLKIMNTMINAYFKFEVPILKYPDSDNGVPIGQNYCRFENLQMFYLMDKLLMQDGFCIDSKYKNLLITNKVGPLNDFRSTDLCECT